MLDFSGVIDSILSFGAGFLSGNIKLLIEIGDTAAQLMADDKTSAVGAVSTQLVKVASKFIPCMMGVGYGICIMFFLFQLLMLVTSEQLTLEQFIKKFCWLFVGIFMVGKSNVFFKKIFEFGQGFTNLIVQNSFKIKGVADSNEFKDSLVETMKGTLGGDGMGDVVTAVIYCIACLAIALLLIFFEAILLALVYVVAFSWTLEVGIYGTFLPIALGVFSDEGWRGAGGRYFRKFLAICCRGAVIALIGKITTGCIAIAYNKAFHNIDGGDGIVDFLLNLMSAEVVVFGIAIASVSLMFKAQQVIGDAVGGQ